jgi:hypothetical protein
MMRLLSLLLIALGSGCSALAGNETPHDGICTHPAPIVEGAASRSEANPSYRTYESPCILQTKSLAVRRGRSLRLAFRDGTARTYVDSSTKACQSGPYENCRQYLLYDYFPEHKLFLVNVGYYESEDWLLVRQLNGKEEKVVAPPRYSPNKKWLASVYWTEGTDDGNNGIDIVSTSANQAQRSFHYRPSEYELWEFVAWDGDDRLSLTVTWRVGNNPELVTWPAEVIRVKGEWQLNRWAPISTR